MTFRFGSQTPARLRVGTAAIQRIYAGSQIVWSGANPIPVENALTGVADSTVGYASIGSGTNGFYGYAKQFSRNVGESIGFAVDGVNATNIAIHRIGHYGGLRWRLIETISNTPTNQPDTQVLPNSAGSRSAANWSTTATWNIPADAVSGLYVAVVRDAGNVARSWIPFIVREDGRTADIVLRVSDSTWAGAYNTFGTKADPLGGKSVYGEGKGGSLFDINLRGVQMSYDRPIVSRGTNAGDAVVNHWDVLESALIDWVEKNGYNVKYISCYDLDQGLTAVGDAKILACAGHDEYWSDGMYDNTEAFVAAGGHHVSMSANSLFWRIRWADNGRTFWCYKDTMPGPTALRSGGAGTPLDPVSWTGTWRDTRWAQRRPENLLLGATFRMNGISDRTMTINGAANQAKPFWRNTTVAAGNNLTVAEVIGFEADSLDFPHSGGVDLGATTINIDGAYADDNGQTYNNNGTLNWGIACLYPRPDTGSGLNIHFSTNQWMWGLSNYHRRGGAVINREMRQATYNMLTDLGAVAATKESDLTTVTPVALSTYGATRVDAVSVTVAPSSALEDGAPNLVFTFTRTRTSGALTVNYTIGGTATNGTDYATIGTSVVIPDGSATGTVTVNPATDATFESDETVILTLASGTGYIFGASRSATGTITNDDAAPAGPFQLISDATTGSQVVENQSYELGTAFAITSGAYALEAIRFYRDPVPGTTVVSTWRLRLWNADTQQLLNTAVAGGPGSGWVNATFAGVPTLVAGTNYVVSCSIPANAGYQAASGTFASSVTPGAPNPLTAPATAGRFIGGQQGVYPATTSTGYYAIQPVVNAPTVATEYPLISQSFTGALDNDGAGYEMGTIFTTSENASVKSVAFYRAAGGNNVARTWTARLWNNTTGNVIGTATVSTTNGQTGWVEAVFSSPVAIVPGTEYTASYSLPTGARYSSQSGFFDVGYTPGAPSPLSAPINAGRFNTTLGSRPTDSFNNGYYFVQPVVTFE